MKSVQVQRRAGLTLMELVLAMSLFAVVAMKVVTALNTANESTQVDIDRTALETQAHRVLQQIGFAIMGSHPDSLVPSTMQPMTSTSMKYQVSLGIAEGQVIWSDPERVALEEAQSHVYWSDNPDDEDERRVVWTNLVAPFLEGEVPNGIDDNGNGLIDEKGLAFAIDGTTIQMHLTLERVQSDGTVLRQTVAKTVACRNSVGNWRTTE